MTMTPQRIHALVDRLLARDQVYRPLELLRLTLRLGNEDQRRWERGELKVLEDGLAGDPDIIIEMLREAAAWAGRLALRAEEVSSGGRMFHSGNADRLARTVWHRAAPTPQGDLFLDSGFSAARNALSRALLDGDVRAAEDSLADMARAEPGHDVQADAEHLVGALGWLARPVTDAAAMLKTIDDDLHVRAMRFFGRRDGERFLKPFWEHLMGSLNASDFDPDRPMLHPSALALRTGDWDRVIASIEAVDDACQHAVLMSRLARAGLAGEHREAGLRAVCQLCWRHPGQAELWLETCEDEDISRRVERFWDLEPQLQTGLFPAWLVAVGFPMPEIDAEQSPDMPEARAMVVARRLRGEPADTEARQWLQQHVPSLFEVWLSRQR